MSDKVSNDNELDHSLTVLKAFLDRSYGDGGGKWSKRGIQACLNIAASPNVAIKVDDSRIQAALKSWAESGHIEFIGQEGEEEVYLRVLKPFYLD